MIPDPSSGIICPQEDVDGHEENGTDIAHVPPQGLLLDAGESLLQGSFLLLGQAGRGAGGQTTEPQIHHFPPGGFGCCERGTKTWLLESTGAPAPVNAPGSPS